MGKESNIPEIKTSIPGPKAQQWIKRYKAVFGSSTDTFIEKAEGCTFQDVDGNKFLVFAQSSNIAGFSNMEILKAVESQLKKNVTRPARGSSPILIEFVEKLLQKLPRRLQNGRVNFTASGTESVELAITFARAYSGKPIIISYHDSHHGFIGTPYQVSGDQKIKRTWPARISDIIQVPYPKCYRCPFNQNSTNCDLLCLSYLEGTIETAALPEQIAALLFEPILVNGGLYVPPEKYVKGIEKLCKDNDILLIIDEVYTGIGKSGNFLAVEQWGITPDILCLGKALGGGFPLAAVVTKREITDDTLGGVKFTSTFSGNLVACSTGLATINYLEKNRLDVNAVEIGDYFMKLLNELGQERRRIGDVRGMGLLIGLDIVEDRNSGKPNGTRARAV
jgi:4-aminobutyrate aminotransferase-like enzyme